MADQLLAISKHFKKHGLIVVVLATLMVFALTGCSAQASAPIGLESTAEQPILEQQPVVETPAPVEPTATAELPAPIEPADSQATVSFSNDVMPILQASCANCHGIDRVSRGLDVTSYDKLMAGSTAGAVVIPGDPNASKLVTSIVSGKMPKRGEKLSPEQLQIISDWVLQGAPNN